MSEDFKTILRDAVLAAVYLWAPFNPVMYVLAAFLTAVLIIAVLSQDDYGDYSSKTTRIVRSALCVVVLLALAINKVWILFTFVGIISMYIFVQNFIQEH